MSETNVLYKMREKTAHESMLFTLNQPFQCSLVLMLWPKHITSSGNAVQHPWIWGTHGGGFLGRS